MALMLPGPGGQALQQVLLLHVKTVLPGIMLVSSRSYRRVSVE